MNHLLSTRSTRALYTLKWRSFERWGAVRQRDPVNCALGVILEFLQQLFDEGKAASTLKVYLAAISACHAGINGKSPGSHPLASRFMAGVRRLRVPDRHLIPSYMNLLGGQDNDGLVCVFGCHCYSRVMGYSPICYIAVHCDREHLGLRP